MIGQDLKTCRALSIDGEVWRDNWRAEGRWSIRKPILASRGPDERDILTVGLIALCTESGRMERRQDLVASDHSGACSCSSLKSSPEWVEKQSRPLSSAPTVHSNRSGGPVVHGVLPREGTISYTMDHGSVVQLVTRDKPDFGPASGFRLGFVCH